MFSVVADKATGRPRWLTIHTNVYRDREGEAFRGKAHEDFVAWVDAEPATRMPELRAWHLPGSKMGRADMVDYDADSGFVIASGLFDRGKEHHASALAAMKDLGCSHGYKYTRDSLRNGVYDAYRDFEITVLPRNKAANDLTAMFTIAEGTKMALNPQKLEFLKSIGGEEWAAGIQTNLSALAVKAKDSGVVSYKEIEDFVESLASKAGTSDMSGDDGDTAKKPKAGGSSDEEGDDAPGKKDADSPVLEAIKAMSEKLDGVIADVEGLKAEGPGSSRPRFDPSAGRPATGAKDNILSPTDQRAKDMQTAEAPAVPAHLSYLFNSDGSVKMPGGGSAAAPVGASA